MLPAVTDSTEQTLRVLLAESPDRAWRAFIDEYTPAILKLIRRSGVIDHDEAMELYVLVCERLAADEYARLRRWNPARGSLAAWLAVVVRHVAVDWVRARAGRRRLFHAVKRLDRFHQRVFELFYWHDRTPAEIAEVLGAELRTAVSLGDVLDAVDVIHGVLSDRHRSELLMATARSRPPVSLGGDTGEPLVDPVDPAPDPEARLGLRQREEAFSRALAELPAEDAAIVRLKYVQGLSHQDIRLALHLDRLSDERVRGIVATLKARLASPQRGTMNDRQADQGVQKGGVP